MSKIIKKVKRPSKHNNPMNTQEQLFPLNSPDKTGKDEDADKSGKDDKSDKTLPETSPSTSDENESSSENIQKINIK